MAVFASQLKDAVDLDSVRDDLAGAVQQALEPAHISIWVGGHTRDRPLSGPPGGPDGDRSFLSSKTLDIMHGKPNALDHRPGTYASGTVQNRAAPGRPPVEP